MTEKLKTVLPKCQALDINGKKCRKIAEHKVNYHGDNEIYHNFHNKAVTWVQTHLCDEHNEAIK